MTKRPNVLLLVFDTLRADFAFGTHPDHQPDTPHLDQLVADGTAFQNAFSVAPGTPASHGAMFTGQYPSETGVVGPGNKFPGNIPVLASWLREAGYDTVGICGPTKIAATHGFARGFEDYIEPFHKHIEPDISLPYLKQVLTDPFVTRDAAWTFRSGLDSITNLEFDTPAPGR